MAVMADNGGRIDLGKARAQLEESRQLLRESREQRLALEARLRETERALAELHARPTRSVVARVLDAVRAGY